MNWTKTELPDGRERYNGKINNRKVGVYDWKGQMTSDGTPPTANVGYNVWDKNGNNGIFRASDTAENAMREAEQYAGQPNSRAWVIIVFAVVVLITLFLLANGVGL